MLDGFQVDAVWNDHIFPYEIEPYKRYEYRKTWYFRYLPTSVFRRLERVGGWHKMLIARLPQPSRLGG